MRPMIDVLESRTLLSVASGFSSHNAQVLAGARVARAAVAGGTATLLADLRGVGADLQSLPNTPANRQMLTTLRADTQKLHTKLGADITATVNAAEPSARKLLGEGIAVLTHPTHLALQTQFLSDLNSLSDVLNAPGNTLASDAQAGRDQLLSDLNNLVAANQGNAALAADVQKIQADSQSIVDQVNTELQAVQNSFSSLIAALTGG